MKEIILIKNGELALKGQCKQNPRSLTAGVVFW